MRLLAFALLILNLGIVGCSTTSTTRNDNKQTTGVGTNATMVEIEETLKLAKKRVDQTFEEVMVLMCEEIKKQDYQSAINVGSPILVKVDDPKKELGNANFLALCTLLFISYEELGYSEQGKAMKSVLGGEEAAKVFAALFKENLNNPVGLLNYLKENMK